MTKIKIECKSCKGTGLYQGFAESKGCAVICHDCNGKGFQDFFYKEFNGLQPRTYIKRVFKDSFGYVHSAEDVITTEGETIEFSKGGCTYEEWLKGIEPKPVKKLCCPYLWTFQDLQSNDVNKLYENYCKKNIQLGCHISNCLRYTNKEECWKIFESKRSE